MTDRVRPRSTHGCFIIRTPDGYVGRYDISENYRTDMPGSHASVFRAEDRPWAEVDHPSFEIVPWDTSMPDPPDVQ